MKNEKILKDFLGKRYALFLEQLDQLPEELRRLVNDNRETLEDMLAAGFDLGMLTAACETKDEVER